MPDPYLSCALDVHAGALRVQARFDLHAPWTCLFGASGSGKTTILRTLAGFTRPRTGILRLADGRILFDASRRLFTPPHRRPIRAAAQQAWLFPGSVVDNIRYGMVSSAPKHAEEEILTRFELTPFARNDVRTLSGGQRQRVSLARAVASALHAREPIALLLLDEPFTGFDLDLRNRLANDLRSWLQERHLPVLSVTHDVPEALLLEADTIRIHEGQIVAHGPAAKVLSAERQTILNTLK